MKVDAQCPKCGQMPVDVLDMVDGEIWICPACGDQEIGDGVDIEAQLNALTELDPDIAASWRECLTAPPG